MSEIILGAAIFGAGWVAGEHAKAYQKCKRTRLVAVGSRKLESARACAEKVGASDALITTDFEEILQHPGVDVISICTPPDLHADLAIRAAKAGKHLCIEKPLALDWDSCLAMQSAVRESGVKSVVSFVLHWNPSLVTTKNLVERGAIGTPSYIEVDYWHGQQKWYPQYAWGLTKAQGGSSLLSAGCHAVDALRWFAGNDNAVVEVSAMQAPHRGDNPDWEFPPTTVLICKVASILDCVMPYQFNVDIIGTKGTLRDNQVWSPELFPGQTDWATIPTVLPNSGDVTHHPFDGQIQALAAAILDGASCLPDLDDAIKTHELIFAADQSAATGQPVKLPLET
ncbi:MAG: Gfo/Idh/MocA family oxidoreductase [Armatimonadetes bacterium]|nr:Gfo/Idh/MocA family oxidoreductase [Armatimonadota bacterium]